MRQELLHELNIFGRIVSGAIALFAFYLLAFLYESEDGVWQSRIDKLWMSIYDRAKATDSLSTALLNKVAQLFLRGFAKLFGQSSFSLQMVCVSMNLSVAGFWFAGAVIESDTIFLVLGSLFLIAALYMVWRPKVWDILFASIPCIAAIGFVIYQLAGFVVAALLISLCADVVTVALIKQQLTKIAVSPTLLGCMKAIGLLGSAILLVEGTPVGIAMKSNLLGNKNYHEFAVISGYVAVLNATTAVYCLLPMLTLVFLLLHRAIWPTLSRLIYPLCRFKVFNNRKIMAAVGALGLSFALNWQRIGLKPIVDLISK